MTLDLDAAYRACEQVGRRMGLDAEETAWGIRHLALEGMNQAVRSLLNARGLDARDHALISYGGCGSLFTPDIARAIGERTVLVPDQASVLSAFGAAMTDIQRERVHSLALALPADAGALHALAEKLAAEVLDDLAADGVAERDRSVRFDADLRFQRQIWELTIPLAGATITDEALAELTDRFREEYARRYGNGSMTLGAQMELVTLRATGIGRTVRASFDGVTREPVADGTAAQPAGSRSVRLARGHGGRQMLTTYEGETLRPGHRLAGPALVDGVDTTIWIPRETSVRLDERSTLFMELKP
jgi:N-methylhydantoinase A